MYDGPRNYRCSFLGPPSHGNPRVLNMALESLKFAHCLPAVCSWCVFSILLPIQGSSVSFKRRDPHQNPFKFVETNHASLWRQMSPKKVMECLLPWSLASWGALIFEAEPDSYYQGCYANHLVEKLSQEKTRSCIQFFDFWIAAKVAAEADVLQQQALWKHHFLQHIHAILSSFVGCYYSWFYTVFHLIIMALFSSNLLILYGMCVHLAHEKITFC